jgi:hypothetical protein
LNYFRLGLWQGSEHGKQGLLESLGLPISFEVVVLEY